MQLLLPSKDQRLLLCSAGFIANADSPFRLEVLNKMQATDELTEVSTGIAFLFLLREEAVRKGVASQRRRIATHCLDHCSAWLFGSGWNPLVSGRSCIKLYSQHN